MTAPSSSTRSELAQAISGLKRFFFTAGVFSFFINLLMLVPAIYMLQVYDRVLASRSETTLTMLTIIMLGLFALMAVLEWLRSQLLVQAGLRMDADLNQRVLSASFQQNLRHSGSNAGQAMADLVSVRQFLTGNGLFAFFDAPWTPIFIFVIFMLHPLLGAVSVVAGLMLVALTFLTERMTQRPLAEANSANVAANLYITNSLRNAEVIEAMGMFPALRARWYAMHRRMLGLQTLASDRAGGISALTRFVRISFQSLILGAGALLVIEDKSTPGTMIAASILMGRALAPVELLIGNWKNFVGARASYRRLEKMLKAFPAALERMSLPAPKGHYALENVVAGAPGSTTPILRGINITIPAGSVVGVIGPSGSGKSTLARLLVGVWAAGAGVVRLDGADIFAWDKTELGPHMGYLPQDVELFDGTVAENISRFGEVDAQAVVRAAQRAGVHEMILRLPQGYDTPIGAGGSVLSGGQRQRIGLARAIYGDPSVVVLDEPNSNLDDVGEAALVNAITQLKREGKTVIVITHRTSVLSAVDLLLVMREGMVQLFGPRNEVLAALASANQQGAGQQPARQATPA